MPGLLDQAGGASKAFRGAPETAHQNWEESMLRSIEQLRNCIRSNQPELIAHNAGGSFSDLGIHLKYWGQEMTIRWPELEAYDDQTKACSTFDTAILIYYLQTADGTPMADRWIGFRELPHGAFYNQAFQGYAGDYLGRHFGSHPERLEAAAERLNGWNLPLITPFAFAFQPLPLIRLAAVLWPGDEEFPAKASILFDACASHYMPTDGLAILGSGLTRRLVKADHPISD
jgi:hypothetical protein